MDFFLEKKNLNFSQDGRLESFLGTSRTFLWNYSEKVLISDLLQST